MPSVPDRTHFEQAYEGNAPWDIGKPQKPLVDKAKLIKGAILDCGCGTGENALYLAEKGCTVTGIDFLDKPIEQAKRKAAERKLTATFLVKDALTLKDWSERFDNVIDSGLFHVFNDDDRQTYVAGLATILKSGGKLFLMCFSTDEPGEHGPRRVSRDEVFKAFKTGWGLELIAPIQFEIRPDVKDMVFSEGGPKAWFVIARKLA